MMKPRGKIAALATGAGCFALALFFWQDLAVEYHLFRLRRDPEYFRKLTLERDGTLSRRALIGYIRTEPGKRRLLEEYIRPLVEHLRRRRASDEIIQSRTAIVTFIDGSFRYKIYSPSGSPRGQFDTPTDPELLTYLHSLLPHISGEAVVLEGYSEHLFSVISIEEIDRKTRRAFWSDAGGAVPGDQIGLYIEHRIVRLDHAARIAGDWQYQAHDDKAPIPFGSIRFLEDGRFRASKVRRIDGLKSNSPETETSAWEESVHEGTYSIEGNALSFSFGSGRVETYGIEFYPDDTLILRADGGRCDFLRDSDIPPGRGNKIGIAALKGPED